MCSGSWLVARGSWLETITQLPNYPITRLPDLLFPLVHDFRVDDVAVDLPRRLRSSAGSAAAGSSASRALAARRRAGRLLLVYRLGGLVFPRRTRIQRAL